MRLFRYVPKMQFECSLTRKPEPSIDLGAIVGRSRFFSIELLQSNHHNFGKK